MANADSDLFVSINIEGNYFESFERTQELRFGLSMSYPETGSNMKLNVIQRSFKVL